MPGRGWASPTCERNKIESEKVLDDLTLANWLTERLEKHKEFVDQLIGSPELPFDASLRSKLPERQGLYAIRIRSSAASHYLRAGRTKTAFGGLRQRVYQNHFMGDQQGNLRSQLVRDGRCSSLEDTKAWIRENCVVQVMVVDDEEERRWAEHFMLSILRPEYCD